MVAIVIMEVVGYHCLARHHCQSCGSSLPSVPWLNIDVIIIICCLVGGDGWHLHCALVAVHLWVADGRVVFVIALVVVALMASVLCALVMAGSLSFSHWRRRLVWVSFVCW